MLLGKFILLQMAEYWAKIYPSGLNPNDVYITTLLPGVRPSYRFSLCLLMGFFAEADEGCYIGPSGKPLWS